MCPVLFYMHDCTNGYGFIQVFAVAQRMCNTGSDCNSDECCVSNNPPRGKRFLETHSHLGHCVPMGTDGSSKFFLCSKFAIYYSLLIHNILQHSSIRVFQKDKHCSKRFYVEENTALV